MTSRAEGGGVYDIVTMRDVGRRRVKRFCDVTHVTSAARPGQRVGNDSVSIQVRQFSQQKSLLRIGTWYTMLTVANVSNHSTYCVVFEFWNLYRSVRYTLQTARGGLDICDVIFWDPKQRDEMWRRREGIIFPKIAWRHLWTTPDVYG